MRHPQPAKPEYENLLEDEINESSILHLNDSSVRMPDILFQHNQGDQSLFNEDKYFLNDSIKNTDLEHLVHFESAESCFGEKKM